MIFLPMRDHYVDLTDKTIHLFQLAYESAAPIVVKMDDDNCMNTTLLLEFSRGAGELFYASDRIRTDDGLTWGLGGCYALSRPLLARILSKEMNAYVNLYAAYGSSNEDLNVARWIQRVRETFHCDVEMKELSGLINSGPHTAAEREKEENAKRRLMFAIKSAIIISMGCFFSICLFRRRIMEYAQKRIAVVTLAMDTE